MHYTQTTALWHVDPGDPDSPRLSAEQLLGRVPEQARRVFGYLAGRLVPGRRVGPSILSGALLLAGFAFVLIKRRGTMEFTTLGLGVALLAYFGAQERHW